MNLKVGFARVTQTLFVCYNNITNSFLVKSVDILTHRSLSIFLFICILNYSEDSSEDYYLF